MTTRRRWGWWALRLIVGLVVVLPVVGLLGPVVGAVRWVRGALGRWRWQALRVMLRVFAAVAAVGALGAALWVIWRVPHMLYTGYILDPKDRATIESSTRNGILATLVGLAALGSLVLTNRTYRLTQQGQLADRYTRAIAQLGDDKLDVRLGGIYALERIAVDSKRDHSTVVEVLSAYVRERRGSTQMTRAANRRTAHPLTIRKQVKLGADIQAALTVLGRLPRRSGISRGDLSEVSLTGAYLGHSNLSRADLFGTRLSEVTLVRANLTDVTLHTADLAGADLLGADLRKARLAEAKLTRANLCFARLTRADLQGADLAGARLVGANLTQADLSGADFTKADLAGAMLALANLSGANLTEAQGLLQHQVNVAFGDKETQLPPGLRHPAWWRKLAALLRRIDSI